MDKEKCGKCGGTEWIGVEYSWDSPQHYDGVSEWKCKQCGTRYGRWSNKILKDGEVEERYGKRKKRPSKNQTQGGKMYDKCYRCGKVLTTADGYGFTTGLCTNCYWEINSVGIDDNTNTKCPHCKREVQDDS